MESVASTFSAVEGALETAAEGALETAAEGALEARAVPKALSAPLAPPDVVSGVVSNALAGVGLSPFVSDNPLAPVDSPAELAVLAWARRQNQQTQSSFGRLFPVEVSSEEPALAPLNQQTKQQLADLAQTILATGVSGEEMAALAPLNQQTKQQLADLAQTILAQTILETDVAAGVSVEEMAALAPLNQQTNQQLADLAQTMLETDAIDNPKGTTAGVTFFGQFIDHDLTLDNEPQPTDTVDVEGLVNGRSFALDLDSVYGGGPKQSPQLYDGDKFLIGTATDGVSPDLPRNPDGSAILVEHRNDENLIIAQMHLSFLRLHNSLIDQGMSYDQAHQTVVGAYRYVVQNDYLPQIVGQEAVDQALSQDPNAGFYQPGSQDPPMTPVEFSTAAFRFGHSQVRNAYAINDASGGVRVFSLDPTVPDLRGGRRLPADPLDPNDPTKQNLVIDFNNFFSELPRDSDEEPALIGRAIDTHIAPSLFELPIPGAEASGSNVLAFRNLVRSKFYDVPSGEAIAGAMGVPVVGEPVFPEGTPLWFYILREAEMTTGGAELGPVGGGIVAEVIVDTLRSEGGTIEKPNLPDVSGGDFTIGDLLVAADPSQPDPIDL